MKSNNSLTISLYVIFAVSGFSGLIYESIWTHYLKLVLGHAAHSQTLVLAIFMGGMAIGAWLISKKSQKISNPILVYAVIELIIGILALLFHKVFIATQGILYESILVNVDSANVAIIIRWLWAALLILPQSILLGATFPLMSAGIVRLIPNKTGSVLSMLYFTNSIGAAIGVLVSGFVLIDLVGLPGTILTAGMLNIFLAIFVWVIIKGAEESINASNNIKPVEEPSAGTFSNAKIILMAAFLTGLASFFYEIGWIRMLSLVLGTTTQAFELMLSAFITGIAFGGLWIRGRIDKINNILRFAGYTQILMGLMALTTLILYNSTFDFMGFLMSGLQRNDSGYNIFIANSHLIAFVIMVPTTFFAGMTLPLFTYSYIKTGHGEKGIGRVYAANTLGSIIGIFLAVHFVMPVFGLKNLISMGCLIDILLGVALIYWGTGKQFSIKSKIAITASLLAFAIINITTVFDEGKMASGVYRYGVMTIKKEDIIFQKDGKTSTVVVIDKKSKDGKSSQRAILTNGKSDAAVSFGGAPASIDEPTMLLSGVLPLAAYPEAKSAAVIGIGSGITSNTLLKTNTLKKVDTVEIEKAMIQGARLFEQHSALVYSDPRSEIHIDDAKSFFAVNNKKYDLIISEPSNPWVSGVASLFTTEFYQQIKRHLNEGGILTQWIQAYEIDMGLLSSILKALLQEFKYVVAYQATGNDLVLLASDDDKVLKLNSWVFSQNKLAKALERVDIKNIHDLYAKRIASKKILSPLFNSYDNSINSDYFPVVSRQAPKARFMKKNSLDFINLRYARLPVLDMLDPLPTNASRFGFTRSHRFQHSNEDEVANNIYSYLVKGVSQDVRDVSIKLNLAVRDLKMYLSNCKFNSNIDDNLVILAELINVYLPASKADDFWNKLLSKSCSKPLNKVTEKLLYLFKAVGQRNPGAIQKSVRLFTLAEINSLASNKRLTSYIYIAEMTALLAEGKYAVAANFDASMPVIYDSRYPKPIIVRLLHSLMLDKGYQIKSTGG